MPPRRKRSDVQDDAARLVRNAQDDAARLVRNAQDDAARLVRNAQDDAARLVRNAQDEKESESSDDTHAQLNEKAALKKDKLYTIGEMSSRLVHDLQNQLMIIKNAVENLRLEQPDADEKTVESHERIARATSRMSQTIREILDYVRTSGLAMERTSLIALLKTVSSELEIPSTAKIIFPVEDIDIYCDVKQLEIVFSNLLLNAVHATGGNGRIMIQATELDDQIVIDVMDNGHGIEKENMPKIFEPLFTTKRHGTGLGLVSCKSIIEAHGGTIECSSIVNKGTVFTLRFPK